MQIKKSLKTIETFLAKYWQKWTILVILVMVICIGFILYQYIYKPIYQFKEITAQRLEIRKDIYQELADSYLEIQDNINRIINNDYPNIFK